MKQNQNGDVWIRAKATDDPGVKSDKMDLMASSIDIEAEAPPKEGETAQARKFSMEAYTGGAMNVGAFFHPVVIDLSGLETGSSARPILIGHDDSIDSILGQTEKIEVKDGSLFVQGRVYGESTKAKQVIALNDKGFKFQASVGARVLNREFVPDGSTATVNGRKFSGPVNIARKAVLGEVSFVILGADDQTSARIAANAAKGISMDFAKWLEAKGFTLADLTDVQRTSLQASFDAEQVSAKSNAGGNAGKQLNPDQQTLDTILESERVKEKKRKLIVDLTAQAIQDSPGQLAIIEALSRQAMEGEWETQRFELELLRATRPKATGRSRVPVDESLSGEMVEAALCISGGMSRPDAEKEFSAQTLEAADKRWRHGIGLCEVLLMFARRHGHDAISTRNLEPLLKAAFTESDNRMLLASASNSTLSLSGILANTANKFLKRGFDSVESTWRPVSAIRSVRDFKQITSYSLTGDFKYEQVPAGGQLKHATVGETSYTNQANTYGKIFGIDRRDLKNDDIGALTQVPQRMGRGGALKFNEVYWTEFLADHTSGGTFFPTNDANLNYLAGATAGTNDTRMNIEGVGRAEAKLMSQTDPDGHPLGAIPKILLVPNALNAAAFSVMNSTEVRDTTASSKYGVSNPHVGKFTVVRSSYLSNSAMGGGYSSDAWYLLVDPADIAFIEVCFLDGIESPTVEQAEADFNSLGIQMRAYHDFGVNKQEYRAAVKMKGAA